MGAWPQLLDPPSCRAPLQHPLEMSHRVVNKHLSPGPPPVLLTWLVPFLVDKSTCGATACTDAPRMKINCRHAAISGRRRMEQHVVRLPRKRLEGPTFREDNAKIRDNLTHVPLACSWSSRARAAAARQCRSAVSPGPTITASARSASTAKWRSKRSSYENMADSRPWR